MESVKYCEIPAYLRKGNFFRSLANDDPECLFEIPTEQFHRDGNFVADFDEFCNLLETMAFWMLDDLPLGLLEFCDRTETAQWVDEITRFPQAVQSMCFAGLVTAYSTKNLGDFTNFINTSRWEVVVHVFGKLKKVWSGTRVCSPSQHSLGVYVVWSMPINKGCSGAGRQLRWLCKADKWSACGTCWITNVRTSTESATWPVASANLPVWRCYWSMERLVT